MNEHGRLPPLEGGQHVGHAGQSRLTRERGGGQAHAERAAVQQRLDGLRDGRAGPQAERISELEDPIVEGIEERLRLVGAERLDAERERWRDGDEVEPVAVGLQRAPDGVMIGQGDSRRRLAGELQRPLRAVAQQARGRGATREHAQQRLGPEVLMEVKAHPNHSSDPYQISGEWLRR
jgi:hypothetical protein